MPAITLQAAGARWALPPPPFPAIYSSAGPLAQTPAALTAAWEMAQGESMSLRVKEIPRHSEPVEEATNSQAWANLEISAARTSQRECRSHISLCSPRCPLEIVRNTAQ